MTKPKDDLDAVRGVVEALEGFEASDQQRIIRWASEKLGLVSPSLDAPPAQRSTTPPTHHEVARPPHGETPTNIRSFVEAKDPKNDQHFAAVIAYYYRFEAPEGERKDEITGADLQEACRQANRTRLQNPGQTLRNAHQRGVVDKGSGTGAYRINAVGENLVAMALPLNGGAAPARAAVKKSPKKTSTKASQKKAGASAGQKKGSAKSRTKK